MCMTESTQLSSLPRRREGLIWGYKERPQPRRLGGRSGAVSDPQAVRKPLSPRFHTVCIVFAHGAGPGATGIAPRHLMDRATQHRRK